jgi:hypothetical protein
MKDYGSKLPKELARAGSAEPEVRSNSTYRKGNKERSKLGCFISFCL